MKSPLCPLSPSPLGGWAALTANIYSQLPLGCHLSPRAPSPRSGPPPYLPSPRPALVRQTLTYSIKSNEVMLISISLPSLLPATRRAEGPRGTPCAALWCVLARGGVHGARHPDKHPDCKSCHKPNGPCRVFTNLCVDWPAGWWPPRPPSRTTHAIGRGGGAGRARREGGLVGAGRPVGGWSGRRRKSARRRGIDNLCKH